MTSPTIELPDLLTPEGLREVARRLADGYLEWFLESIPSDEYAKAEIASLMEQFCSRVLIQYTEQTRERLTQEALAQAEDRLAAKHTRELVAAVRTEREKALTAVNDGITEADRRGAPNEHLMGMRHALGLLRERDLQDAFDQLSS